MTSATPGRIRPDPEEAGITQLQHEGTRSMTVRNNLTRPAIAADIRLLVGNCRGPAATKARLCDWASTLETGAEAAFDMQTLQRTCDDLVQISHANAGFSLAPAPDDSSEPMLEINDTGGYLLARLIIAEVEKAAPIGPRHRAELASHTRSVTKRQMARIVSLLQGR